MRIKQHLTGKSVAALLFAGLFLVCAGPVSAADQISIDPVSGNLKTETIFAITGTTTLPVETNLKYEFFSEGLETDSVRQGDYSGQESTIMVRKGDSGQVWKADLSTEYYAPGWYVFRIGKQGGDDPISTRIYLAQGTLPTTPQPTTQGESSFKSPVYMSPKATFDVQTNPELTSRNGCFAKGCPLDITGRTTPDGVVGIWVYHVSSENGYALFEMITADGSGNFEYTLPGTDTISMKSGQYFLYIVNGNQNLEVIPGNGNADKLSSRKLLEAELNNHENENPYQQCVMLLEEPWIRINRIPDSATDKSLEISGTTNLNGGTDLKVELIPPEADRLQQSVISVPDVKVADGTDGYGEWHVVTDTSTLPPGEYVVRVSTGSTEATGLMILYDSLYDASVSPDGGLDVQTYDVDPETKTVFTPAEPEVGDLPGVPGLLVISFVAILACLGGVAVVFLKK